jgi:hypothetical protein
MKTAVDGNRVTIDDTVYLVTPAGTNQYAVADDFGAKLGYFTVRGKTVTPEDYGTPGAHPVAQIGRLWLAANSGAAEKVGPPVTKGLCRIVTHDQPAEADAAKARAYRAWLRKQPGCKASYYVHDPATGKAMSISIWGTRAQLDAVKEADGPGGGPGLAATTVELYPMVEDP